MGGTTAKIAHCEGTKSVVLNLTVAGTGTVCVLPTCCGEEQIVA